ncbi:MAG: hypothetical protein Q8L87_18210 [Anaerolineales bacterium]|jgi:hypothetical protein|nr:hypothetical protein [Anaerolineales bacterium]
MGRAPPFKKFLLSSSGGEFIMQAKTESSTILENSTKVPDRSYLHWQLMNKADEKEKVDGYLEIHHERQ